jgi:hypothetical protein
MSAEFRDGRTLLEGIHRGDDEAAEDGCAAGATADEDDSCRADELFRAALRRIIVDTSELRYPAGHRAQSDECRGVYTPGEEDCVDVHAVSRTGKDRVLRAVSKGCSISARVSGTQESHGVRDNRGKNSNTD